MSPFTPSSSDNYTWGLRDLASRRAITGERSPAGEQS